MRLFSAKLVMPEHREQNRDVVTASSQRSQFGGVMVMMLAVVLMLSMGIAVSLTWIQTGIGVAQRAEHALIVEESLNSAVQIATWDLGKIGAQGCEDWVSQTYVLNVRHVPVTCLSEGGHSYLFAAIGARWLRVRVVRAETDHTRWEIVQWEWSGNGAP
jgi:hypothetical protein